MAALIRGTKLGCRLMTVLQRSSPVFKPHIPALPVRVYSSTSKKVNQSEYVIGKRTEVDEERIKEIIRDGEKPPDHTDPSDPSYVSHGFNDDPYADLWSYRVVFFLSISIMMVLGPLYVHYIPDGKSLDWAGREADQVIEDRRKKGLPLITADLCDPAKLILPSEEEEEKAWKVFRS